MRQVRFRATTRLIVTTLLALTSLAGCDASRDVDETTDDTTAAAPGDARNAGDARDTNDGGAAADADATQGPRSTSAGCAVLSTEEVAGAMGFPVVMNDNATGNCIVTPADGSPVSPAVDFRIEPRTNAYDYFAALPDATPIEGMGERAVWATVNDMTGNVVVVTDGRAIVVAIARADGVDAAARRQAEAVARLLLEKRSAR